MSLDNPLTRRVLLAYSAPSLILSALTMALVVYIPPFYATEMRLSLAGVGWVFLIARMWDAVIDTLIGFLSDATRTRWGARKPWLLVAAPVLVVSTYFLFHPGPGATMRYLLLWVFVYYVAWSAVQIPYLSWGAELSSDYAERSRIVAYREGTMFVGVLLATALPIVLFYRREPSLRDILSLFASATALVLPICLWGALRQVPAGTPVVKPSESLLVGLTALAHNRLFLRLISACFFLWLGLHVYNAAVLLVIEFALKLPKSDFLRLVFIQFAVGLLFTPWTIRLASAIGKHRTLAIAGLGVGATLPCLLLVPSGQFFPAAVVFTVLGIVVSPIWVLPTALVADAADFGRLKGGGEQTGLYMSVFNFSVKLALAVSVGIALPLMQALGFDPTATPASGTPWGLVGVGLVLPGVFCLVAFALLWRYPLDRRRYTIVQRWFARKRLTVSRISAAQS
jgi:GPH family glycoside/pentoside/hexuronide:cation symporter